MKKVKHFFLCLFFYGIPAVTTAQLTGTKNIPTDYATLALAITDLNAQGVGAGGVTLNVVAVTPQTTPAGGYIIGGSGNILTGATNPSAANPVIIEGNSNIITASNSQIPGSLNDGIFKLIGADYITIRHFTMQENPANTITPAGTNNMTEWGIALLHVSLTDGAQNNTIQENTISLNRTYRNTFGIYSNARHSATAVATVETITSINGSNFGNKVYANNISNADYGILFVGASVSAFLDDANDIGGASAATSNTISNWGGNSTALSNFNTNTTDNCSIYVHNQVNENVSFNSISSAAITGSTDNVSGIFKSSSATATGASLTSTFNNNSITLSSSNLSGNMFGLNIGAVFTSSNTTININNNSILNCVLNGGGTSSNFTGFNHASNCGTLNITGNIIRGTSTSSNNGSFTGITNIGAVVTTINISNNQLGNAAGNLVNYTVLNFNNLKGIDNSGGAAGASLIIQGNDVRGIVHNVTGSSSHLYISSTVAVLNQQVNNNTFTNIIANTTGNVIFIFKSIEVSPGGSWTCSNNSIVTAFNKPANGGSVTFVSNNGNSINGTTSLETGNNFSNVTVNGGQITGWLVADGMTTSNCPTKTITGNTINNITGADFFWGFLFSYANTPDYSSNTISNISSLGNIIAIYSQTSTQGVHNFSNNNISGLNSTGAGGNVFAIYDVSGSPACNMSNNIINGLSSTGSNALVAGIFGFGATLVNIYGNVISNLTGSGTAAPAAIGINCNAATLNIYRNTISGLAQTGAISTTSPAVTGMVLPGAANATVYNNFISDLRAPAANLLEAIRGIAITGSAVNTNYNLYHNSVYINAISTGTNFGSSGIYHTTNATATTAKLNMINNIVVNTSTPNGTGISTAYRRSNATLTNYAATADYNLWYAGAPAANKLIFYDGTNSNQTLGAFKTTVSPREANSLSSMPNFVSATNLHLTNNNCTLDDKGIPVAGIANDIDIDTRSITVPDIGADEFTAYNSGVLAGIASTAVCTNKAVVNTGTLFIDGSCNRIAKIVPSGADPVTGNINTCVTLDATQLNFNGDPYVQRHYDLEPVTSNQTTTSATITLYFTDAEFALYNSTNPVWPALPTVAGGGSGDPNIANVKVTQFHGTPTFGVPTSTPGNYTGLRVLLAPVSVVLNAGIWEVTINIAGFSGFYVHTNIFNVPLPISINYFTGIKSNGSHLLNWKVTCASTPSATIELERSADGSNYNSIYNIFATALRCQQPFNYTDNQPAKGINYYRLKMTDAEGKVTYSMVVPLINATKGIDVMNIAPNPVVNSTFNLQISSAEKIQIELIITDMQGRVVYKQSENLIAGFNTIPMNVKNLAAGTYQLFGSAADEKTRLLRFVVQ